MVKIATNRVCNITKKLINQELLGTAQLAEKVRQIKQLKLEQ